MENINYILCTSPAEGNPNNIIEGMACGIKPIIHKYLGYENQFPEECCYSRIDEIQNILTNKYDSSEYRNWVESYYDYKQVYKKIEKCITT